MTNIGALKSSSILLCKTKQDSPCKTLVFHAKYIKNNVNQLKYYYS